MTKYKVKYTTQFKKDYPVIPSCVFGYNRV